MAGVWAWLLPILIRLAISVGIPFIIKKFPGIPAELIALLEEIAKHIHDSPDKKAELDKLTKAVRECTGTGCTTEIQRS